MSDDDESILSKESATTYLCEKMHYDSRMQIMASLLSEHDLELLLLRCPNLLTHLHLITRIKKMGEFIAPGGDVLMFKESIQNKRGRKRKGGGATAMNGKRALQKDLNIVRSGHIFSTRHSTFHHTNMVLRPVLSDLISI